MMIVKEAQREKGMRIIEERREEGRIEEGRKLWLVLLAFSQGARGRQSVARVFGAADARHFAVQSEDRLTRPFPAGQTEGARRFEEGLH